MGMDKYCFAFLTMEGLETELNVRIIKIIKKNRKIYVPVSEINRYFSD